MAKFGVECALSIVDLEAYKVNRYNGNIDNQTEIESVLDSRCAGQVPTIKKQAPSISLSACFLLIIL